MLHVICFDISGDKARRKVVNMLLDLGNRVQESVFECRIADASRLEKLLREIDALIDPDTDSVRCYPLSAAAIKQFAMRGAGEPPSNKWYGIS